MRAVIFSREDREACEGKHKFLALFFFASFARHFSFPKLCRSPNATGLELRPDLAYLSVMLIDHVHVRVKPDCVEAFKAATLANARASVQEPGVARFDVGQQADDATRFVLVEVYRDAAAAAAHKETTHYPVWRDTVAAMMAEPRTSVKFNQVYP